MLRTGAARRLLLNGQPWLLPRWSRSSSNNNTIAAVFPPVVTNLTTTKTRLNNNRSSSSNSSSRIGNYYYGRSSSSSCIGLRRRCLSILSSSSSTSRLSDVNQTNNNNGESSTTTASAVGLFSIPNLQTPNDFLTLTSNAIHECNSLRSTLRNLPQPPTTTTQATDILYLLDDISNTICSVIDAAELCRSVHSSSVWRDAASKSFQLLSEYISELNGDVALYEALISVTSQPEIYNQLTEEQQRFATLLQQEFERDGIHMSDTQRSEIRTLQNHVTQLESLFTNNITQDVSYFDVNVGEVERIIPRHVVEQFVPQSNISEDTITISTDAHIANTIGKYSANPELRKEVYMQSHTGCVTNLDVLDSLIATRHLVSTKLGYVSYADRFLRDKMAGNQQNVYEFLLRMGDAVKVGARKEMELLYEAKKKVEKTSDLIEPWDVPFYVGLLKSNDGWDATATKGGGGTNINGHFTLENCINGMILLVNRLFGIQMTEVAMSKEERWDMDDGTQGDVAAGGGGVRKFVFIHDIEGDLGTMYLDLHPREGKYGHAAHFTVRCGCAIRGGTNTNDEKKTKYQLPIVALVCNLTPPSATNNTSSTAPTQLSHSEVETLYHEFGHGLHSLLSRTTFQHLSGTRAAMDFVETPSHLIESYVWDPQFLKLMALHYETCEPLGDEAISKLVKSKNAFRNIEVRNQVVYALFDQTIFGIPDPNNPASTTTDIFAKLHHENEIPYANGTHWHTKFGHLVTYGAGYYGYLYSQVFASDIWHRCLVRSGNTLSRRVGEELLWKGMLQYGGAKDPNVMLRTVLGGREPRVDSFFEGFSL